MYTVTPRKTVSREVAADDTVIYPITLVELLPVEEMRELLRRRLVAQGFQPVDADCYQQTGHIGEQMIVDVAALEARVSLALAKEIRAEVEVAYPTAEDAPEPRKQAARRHAEDELAARGRELETRGHRDVLADVNRRLEEQRDAHLERLHGLLQDVYADALAQKASTLGNILEISEQTSDKGDYQLRIVIEP